MTKDEEKEEVEEEKQEDTILLILRLSSSASRQFLWCFDQSINLNQANTINGQAPN